jgi:hypothetical protein
MTIALLIADAWRILFLTASAPAIGGVLLLAIARVTGARWDAIALPPIAMRLAIPGAALLGLAQLASPPPAHLALWMNPLFVGIRAALAAGLLAFAGARIAPGQSTTFAAVTLALYAALVTPIASDWLLGQVPGHSVSAIGMMLCVEQIAGACALALAVGRGKGRFRGDMAGLMIAAMLALSYFAFVDYLIIWFGNLPARVGFYLAHGGPAGGALIWLALATGLAIPIAALVVKRDAIGQRIAGISTLLALLLFNGWWVGGSFAHG